MKITIKFSEKEYFDAHRIAKAIKSVSGKKYNEIGNGTSSSIIFEDLFCSNRILESLPSLVESLQAKNNTCL